jgi:hypothetical protein
MGEVVSIVTSHRCNGQARIESRTENPEVVQAVANELRSARKDVTAIQAVIFGGCDTQVTLRAVDGKVFRLHVGACKTFEKAPVTGKRYFTYNRGTKDLPALKNLLPAGFNDEAC